MKFKTTMAALDGNHMPDFLALELSTCYEPLWVTADHTIVPASIEDGRNRAN